MLTPHRTGQMLQTLPHGPTITERLPQTVLPRGTTPLPVISTMVRTGDLEEDHHTVVAVVVVVVIPLVGRAMVSGKTASIFQALPTHASSVSFSVPLTTLQNYKPVSISRTTMTSLWKHLAMMFPSLHCNSPTHH